MAPSTKKIVTIHEAKTHLSRFVARAAAGEEIILARGNQPMARLVPLIQDRHDRVPGQSRDEIWISEDFGAALPDSPRAVTRPAIAPARLHSGLYAHVGLAR